MNTLFPVEPVLPSGFEYVAEFISRAEEAQLLHHIQQMELHTFHFQGYEARRKVASFGYDWSFEKRTLSKGKDIPAQFYGLIEKVAGRQQLSVTDISELLITEYPPGSVINWHRDAPPFDVVMGISLQTDGVFKLRPYDKQKQGRKNIFSIPVHRRSLYIMRGEVRTDWEHSIAPVLKTRYSITLRTLKTS